MYLSNRKACPLDPAADPVEEAGLLRSLGPLVRVELPGGVAAWAATDHATAQKVLGHEALTKDPAHWPDLNEGRIRDDWELIALVRGAAMLHEGGSEHRRLRQLVSTAFARAPIEALRPHIEQIAAELLDDLLATGTTGPVDLREHFAYPLPVRVICEVLGVPDTTVSELRHRFDRLVTPRKNASGEEDIRVAQMDIVSSLTALIEAKRGRPGDDLTTALIQARDESDRLSQRELVETLFLVLIAGHETTINSITNTAHALLQNPAVLTAVLQAEDSDAAWEAAVEEGLRYASPVRHALLRYAVKDVEIAGVTIARGEPVLASLAAAGRDTTRHENPDRFDVARSTRREHLAFGFGAHFCLGARLAKLETKIALRALFTRFPALALAEEPARLSSIPLQGYSTLPVHLQSRPVLPDPERGCPADAAPGDA